MLVSILQEPVEAQRNQIKESHKKDKKLSDLI